MSTYNFVLPDIGEGLQQADIVTWFVNMGDEVKENENIVEVQTDKAVVEISSPVSGIVKRLGGEIGDTVQVGSTLIEFIVSENSSEATLQEKNQLEETFNGHAQQAGKMETPSKTKKRVVAAPSVRKAARDAGVDLSEVIPTGKAGKILAADLTNYINNQNQKNEPLAAEKTVSRSEPESVKKEKIIGMRKAIFEKMNESKSKAVHCTGMDEVNVTKLVSTRKSLNGLIDQQETKLTYMPFIIKAVSKALKAHPVFNSSVDEEKMEIHYHPAIHIGIATATDDGLLVPVIKNADQKSVFELAKEIEELSNKARARKLKPSELTGSTFTISNTGSRGGWFATPIINYPEVAIMGIHQIKKQPIIVDEEIGIGSMMGMSLTFDHRIIDGEPSGRFMNDVKEILENPELLLLDIK